MAITIQPTHVVLPEQASAPATPSSGFGALYLDTNGQPYIKTDGGVLLPMGLFANDPVLYNTNAAQSFTTGVEAIMNYEDVIYDPAGRVTIGAAWKYTAATAGVYLVHAICLFTGTTGWANGEAASMIAYKNGAANALLDYRDNYSGGTAQNLFLGGGGFVQMAAADTLDVRVTQGSGITPLVLHSTGRNNQIYIARVF